MEQASDAPQGPGDGSQPGTATAASAARRRPPVLLATLVVVGILAFSAIFVIAVDRLSARTSAPPRPTGIPANVSTHLAYVMQLSPVPDRAAPGFTLTDQAGKKISLAGFRGRTVVLTFMDSHCTDVCPIVSREFIDARQDPGAT